MRAYPSHRRVAAAVLAILAAALVVASPATARSFKLGVAAADVTRESAILWTRADRTGEVTLRLSTSRSLSGARSFELEAERSHDRTVQTRVDDLTPGTTYDYRFVQGDRKSATGVFRTPPRLDADATIRFGFSGDADAQRARGQKNIFYDNLRDGNGFTAESFGVYKRMAEENNDFNVNLGDTMYSDSEVPGIPLARTLAEKRAKYRTNLAVANLRTLRASSGVLNAWDDHEFVNDFTLPEDGRDIYEAGKQAFREYMPVHYSSDDGIYSRQRWGRNLEVFRLDERSFRSAKASAHHVCDNPDTGQPDYAPTLPQSKRDQYALVVPSLANPVSQACKDRIYDPKRTMLGKRQFDRFVKAVRRSTAAFKVVLNPVPIQQQYAFTFDSWETYEAERKRLLHALEDSGVKNLVFLTTDFHANMVNVVRYRTFEAGGPKDSPYSEFVTGPVSTRTWGNEIDSVTGPGNGDLVDAALYSPPPPTGVGMPCSNLDAYSYVEVAVTSSALTVRAKDVHGQPVRDQSDNVTPCVLAVPRQ